MIFLFYYYSGRSISRNAFGIMFVKSRNKTHYDRKCTYSNPNKSISYSNCRSHSMIKTIANDSFMGTSR